MTCPKGALHSIGQCRPLAEDAAVAPVEFIGFDITGGKIEYDILASQGPNTTLRKVLSCRWCTPVFCCARAV